MAVLDVVIKTNDGLVYTEHDAASEATVGLYINSLKVVGKQQATIADASVAHALNGTFSDTEVETALNALGTKINAILLALETHGLLASA